MTAWVNHYVRRIMSANPRLRETDIHLTVTEKVTETERIVVRPATEEEAAQVEIARRIAKLGLK